MADNATAHVCIQVVRTFFGPTSSLIASTLLTRGRLPLAHIVRHTGLKARTVRTCLIVLIQHNVVWFAEGEGESGSGETFYEVNVEEVVMRLRFGKFIELAKEVGGEDAMDIVKSILDHGKLRLPTVLSHLEADSKRKVSLRATFTSLVCAHYLTPTSRLSHTSPKDKIIAWEEEERRKLKEVPSAKVIRQLREKVEAKLRIEREEESTGMKRKATSSGGRPRKRQAVEEEVIDEDVFFRVNYERFNILLRNELISQAATDRYNPTFGAVVTALLRAADDSPNSHPRLSDASSPAISTHSLSPHLPPSTSLSAGLRLPSFSKESTSATIREYLLVLSGTDNPTASGRSQVFCSRFSGGGSDSGGKVQIEFEVIAGRMRRRVVESYVRERWGDGASRVLGILWSDDGGGHMDERQIAKVALMPPNTVRAHLTALHSARLLEMQQVPKTSDRAPQRSFYLWHVAPQSTYHVLLSSMYKTEANLLERLEAEVGNGQKREGASTGSVNGVAKGARGRREAEEERERERRRKRIWVALERVETGVLILRDWVGGIGCGTVPG